jgi:hypothetical protein
MSTKPGSGDACVIRKRCPQCKKVRAYRFDANQWPEDRKMWGRLTDNGPKVCHVCRARAAGEPLPMVHGQSGKKGPQY